MTATLTDAPPEPEPAPSRGRFSSRLVKLVIALVALVALMGAATGWWYLGGPRLHASTESGGTFLTVGHSRNLPVELNSSHGEVIILSALPVAAPPELSITFKGSTLVGPHNAALAAEPPNVQLLHGTRVDGEGPDKAVFMTMVITPTQAGLYRLNGVDITYRANGRIRHARARFNQCILAVNPSDATRVGAEINRAQLTNPPVSSDALVNQYVNCP